jgi:solute carrier family 13 (sodium-dependent dicarboxylate transporter), member 2/3/5
MSETQVSGARRRTVGLLLGPLIAGAMLAAGPPDGVIGEAWIVAALTALMALWWVTEAVPISVTALLPVAVLPHAGARISALALIVVVAGVTLLAVPLLGD